MAPSRLYLGIHLDGEMFDVNGLYLLRDGLIDIKNATFNAVNNSIALETTYKNDDLMSDSGIYEHDGQVAFRGNRLAITYWDSDRVCRSYHGYAMPGGIFVVRDKRSGEVMTHVRPNESELKGSWALDSAMGEVQILLGHKLRRA